MFKLDREIEKILTAAAEHHVALPAAPDDWRTLRKAGSAAMANWAVDAPSYPDVSSKSWYVMSRDGVSVPVRWYWNATNQSEAAVVYAHGGGMICGSVDLFEPVIKRYVHETGVPFLSVDYRLAPEAHGETLAEDVFAALGWLAVNGSSLGIDPARIALMGDSAGGGIAAGAAILARDRGIAVARQLLIYPMLDDRTQTPATELLPYAIWSYDNNYTGWHALLGDDLGKPIVSSIAAPGRLVDFSGLAPAFLEVGELDIFRDEVIEFARRLLASAISTELHVYPGAPHGYDLMAPDSELSHRAMRSRVQAIRSL